MKFVFVAILASVSINCFAQEPQTLSATGGSHSVYLGVEPHWLILGGLGVDFGVRLSDQYSLEIGGFYIPSVERKETSTTSDDAYKWSSYEVYVGPKYMFTGDFDQSGAYILPAIGYTGASITEYSSQKLSGSMATSEFRLVGGYQFVIINKMKINVGGGFRVISSGEVVVKDSSGNEVLKDKSNTAGGVALDANIGFLF